MLRWRSPTGEFIDRWIVALDIDGNEDPEKDGEATIRAFEAAHQPLPPTMTFKSGRVVPGRAVGGRHLIYLVPMGWTGVFKRTLGAGVDIKLGDIGYIAAPTSLHKSGQYYDFLGNAPLAEAPAWLLAEMARPVEASGKQGPATPIGDPFEYGSILSNGLHGISWQETVEGDLEAIVGAIMALDADCDFNLRGQRKFMSPDVFKEIHWSIRALQDWFAHDPRVSKIAFAHAHQFAGHDEKRYFETLWNYRRANGREYGRGHLLAAADRASPGWRTRLSDGGRAAARRLHDDGSPVQVPAWVSASQPAGTGSAPLPIAPAPETPREAGGGYPLSPQRQPKKERPLIQVMGGNLAFEADAAEYHLINQEEPIFVRGQTLVRPITEAGADCRGEVTNSPALVTITPVKMRDTMARNIHWEKYDARAKAWLSTNPSEDHAKTLLSRAGSWNFPLLRGVISTPTLRRDGSLLSKPGYDQQTKIYLERPIPLPWFSDAPTKEDALRALSELDALIEECAFVDDGGASRAAALSALITPGVRVSMDVAPIHVANAPKAGTGKSFLFDLAASIWLGGKCPAVAATDDAVETDKRLVGAVIRGLPIINLDNVSGELSSDFLCQAVSQEKMQIRPLGTSTDALVSNTATLFASGNNIVLRGDITRRAILVNLDAHMVDPEQRVFKRNPLEMVRQNRGHYAACALTIVKAYIAAGSPRQRGLTLNGFEDWARMVRDALMWLGCADSVITMTQAKASDPDRGTLEAIITALRDVHQDGDEPVYRTVRAITRAPNNDACGVLEEAFSDWFRGGEFNLRGIGRIFLKFKGQPVEFKNPDTGAIVKFKLDGRPNRHAKIMEWAVVKA
jgi:putative DNA primase/helicase